MTRTKSMVLYLDDRTPGIEPRWYWFKWRFGGCRVSAEYRSSIDQGGISVVYQWYIGCMSVRSISVVYRSTVGEQLFISVGTCIDRYIDRVLVQYRPSIGRVSDEYRLIYWSICRPILGRYNWPIYIDRGGLKYT